MSLVLDRSDVGTVDDPHSAARLHLELHHQLSRPGLTSEQQAETQSALDELHGRFPDAPHRASVSTAEDLGGLSPEHKRTHMRVRRANGFSAQTAAAERQRLRSQEQPRRPRPAKASPTPARSRGRSGSSGSIKLPSLGLKRSAQGTSRTVLQVFGWGVALSLAYLLLENAQRSRGGRSAVELLFGTLTALVGGLVDPHVDPLSLGHRVGYPGPAAAVDLQAAGEQNIAAGRPPLAGVPGYGVTSAADLAAHPHNRAADPLRAAAGAVLTHPPLRRGHP